MNWLEDILEGYGDLGKQGMRAHQIVEAEKDGRILNDGDPREWARAFAKGRGLLYFQGIFYDRNNAYQPESEEIIESMIAEFLSNCWVARNGEIDKAKPFKPNRSSKAETLSALKNLRIICPKE